MTIYEIRVAGLLDQRWSAWFDGLALTHEGNTTLLRGALVDEAALHGVLVSTPALKGGACGRTPPQFRIPGEACGFGFMVRHIRGN